MKKINICLISILVMMISEQVAFSQTFSNSQTDQKLTVREFCSLNLKKEISVKIQDELSSDKIHNLMLACNGEEKDKIGPIDLDLSNCTFSNGKCNIFITNLKNVRSLVLPKCTKTITFCLAPDMEHIIIPYGVERIEQRAFFRTKLKSVEIPESVQYVGALAFGDNENLQYIKTFNNPYKTKWSSLWNDWNDAKLIEGNADFISGKKEVNEKFGTIQFSKKDYHSSFDTIDFEVKFETIPQKSQKAVLHFYDSHNQDESAGDIEINVKKGQKSITVKKYSAADFFSSETDYYYSIINNFGEYWIKLRSEIEFADGNIFPLDGSCYIYEESYPDSIS